MRYLLIAASTIAIACGGPKAPAAASAPPAQVPRVVFVKDGFGKTCEQADPCPSVREPGERQVNCEKATAGQSLRDRVTEPAAFLCTFAR